MLYIRTRGSIRPAPLSLLVTLLVMGVVTAAPRHAAADATSMLFGSVDLQKVEGGYAKRPDLDKKVQEFSADLNARFKQQAGYDMLTQDQQNQLGALLAKPAPSDQEKATVTQLENASNHDSQELAALQQKQNPTDADKARLTTLTNQHAAGQQALQQIADGYKEQLDAEQTKIAGQFTDLVKAAISAVAKEHGLAVVFDANFALYSANDITDDVVKRLNK